MEDESDQVIINFKNQKQYPDEFITMTGRNGVNGEGFRFLHSFQLEGHPSSIPMCIMVDSEGIVTKIGGFGKGKDFTNYILDYFENHRPQSKNEYDKLAKKDANDNSTAIKVNFIDYAYDTKRRA